MLYTNESTVEYQLHSQERKRTTQQAETPNLRERRTVVAEAVQAFREYRSKLIYDTDVLTLIQQRGAIPFDQWMNAVLYGPDGYYTSGRCGINNGDFTTVVRDPMHVAAFYAAIREHLIGQSIENEEPRVLSVAAGVGNFEQHFLGMHKYYKAMHPELALPASTTLYSLDISEENLRKHANFSGHTTSEALQSFFSVIDNTVVFRGEKSDSEEAPFSIPVQVLKELCSMYDCAGTIVTETEYEEYYSLHILPYLRKKIDDKTYNFLCNHPEYIEHLAPFFTQHFDIPIAGSGFELPFDRNTLDVVFSNELHDAHPSKIFVVNPETDDYEELFVTYDADSQKFVFEMRPIDPAIKPMLTLKMTYVNEQDPATSAGSLPLLQLPNQEQREYLVVNMPSVLYFLEAARVLNSGGMIIEGDYTIANRVGSHTIYGLERIRAGSKNGNYYDLLDHPNIGYYQDPWGDITTDANPGFLAWLAPVLGLQPLFFEDQMSFTKLRTGSNPSQKFNENFQVFAFVKK